LLSIESVSRHGQGIYRAVSVRSLKHNGEIATANGSRDVVDSNGQRSISIGKVCPSIRPEDLSLGLGEES